MAGPLVAAQPVVKAATDALLGDLVRVGTQFYRARKVRQPTGKLTKGGRPAYRTVLIYEPVNVALNVNALSFGALAIGALALGTLAVLGGLSARYPTLDERNRHANIRERIRFLEETLKAGSIDGVPLTPEEIRIFEGELESLDRELKRDFPLGRHVMPMDRPRWAGLL